MNCFEILNIEQTKDVKIIKKAYAKLAVIYHPEESPEKFKVIHDAYENAIKYATKIDTADIDNEYFNNNLVVEEYDNKQQNQYVTEDNHKSDFELCEEELANENIEKIEKATNEVINKIAELIDNKVDDKNIWKRVLSNKRYGIAINSDTFIMKFYDILNVTKLSNILAGEIYYYTFIYQHQNNDIIFSEEGRNSEILLQLKILLLGYFDENNKKNVRLKKVIKRAFLIYIILAFGPLALDLIQKLFTN